MFAPSQTTWKGKSTSVLLISPHNPLIKYVREYLNPGVCLQARHLLITGGVDHSTIKSVGMMFDAGMDISWGCRSATSVCFTRCS